MGSNQLAASGQKVCSRKTLAAFQWAAIAAAMASRVSLGGSHRGQLILVVIIVTLLMADGQTSRGVDATPPRCALRTKKQESVSPYMSDREAHEFLKKPSPFSDENAHHVGIRFAKLMPWKPRRVAAPGSKLSRNL